MHICVLPDVSNKEDIISSHDALAEQKLAGSGVSASYW